MSNTQLPKIELPHYEKLLASLVSVPSISSPSSQWDQSNEGVIRLLAEWFDRIGFDVQLVDVPGSTGKSNLVASFGEGAEGLVLSGHTDTVPYDACKWQSDPFKLSLKDGRYYGLGSCDMKGFFPIILEALRLLEGADFKQPLIILATADEESSMSGARAIAESGLIKGRAAVIGEPTSLRPVRMHKGIMMESIRVSGQAGHSSNPALGNNALEAMYDIIGELLVFRKSMQSKYQNPAFGVTFPSLNLGHIHGGDSPNRICGHCELGFDLRPLPGMNTMALEAEIKALAQRVAIKRGIDISVLPLVDSIEPFEMASDSELVRLAEAMTKSSAEAVAFATEAPFLRSMGLETIVMGAGSIDQAHQPDEYLAVDQIKPMASLLEQLIKHYCIEETA